MEIPANQPANGILKPNIGKAYYFFLKGPKETPH